MGRLVERKLSYIITGLCFQVHNQLGRFCREKQYGDKLEELLLHNEISHRREFEIAKLITETPSGNRVDFLVEDKVVLELKAKRFITKQDYFQMQRYLQAADLELGMVVNFHHSFLKPKRVLNYTKFRNDNSEHQDAIRMSFGSLYPQEDIMKQLSKFRGYLVLAAIIIIAIVGSFWLQDYLRYRDQGPVIDESEFLTYIDRGLTEEAQIHWDSVIAELEASIASQGEEPSLGDMLELGNAYNTVGKLAEAKEMYGQMLVRVPTDAPALENLGSTLYLMQDYYGAEGAWLAAAEISGSEPHILRLVTLINEHIPEHKAQVKDILEIAIDAVGQTPGFLAALGEWYFEQGDFDRAVSHYEVALDLAPEDGNLQTRLEEIKNARKNASQ